MLLCCRTCRMKRYGKRHEKTASRAVSNVSGDSTFVFTTRNTWCQPTRSTGVGRHWSAVAKKMARRKTGMNRTRKKKYPTTDQGWSEASQTHCFGGNPWRMGANARRRRRERSVAPRTVIITIPCFRVVFFPVPTDAARDGQRKRRGVGATIPVRACAAVQTSAPPSRCARAPEIKNGTRERLTRARGRPETAGARRPCGAAVRAGERHGRRTKSREKATGERARGKRIRNARLRSVPRNGGCGPCGGRVGGRR